MLAKGVFQFCCQVTIQTSSSVAQNDPLHWGQDILRLLESGGYSKRVFKQHVPTPAELMEKGAPIAYLKVLAAGVLKLMKTRQISDKKRYLVENLMPKAGLN